MKSKYLAPIVFVLLLVIGYTATAQNEVNFPNDFVLKTNEMPEGFTVRPMDDNAKALGLPDNPGVLTNPNFYSSMYPNADTSSIKQLLIAIYSKPEAANKEVGIFVAEYHTEELLAQEVEKVVPGKELIYLTIGKYMILVWSDGGRYVKETRYAADQLKKRLQLQEIGGSKK